MSELSKSGTRSAKAFASLSIDADSGAAGAKVVIAELLDRLQQLRIAASWALTDFAVAPMMQRNAECAMGHEVALLSDAALAKADLSRTDIMQCVVRPLQLAADGGINISTLAVGYAWQPRHIDLLTKYGLTMIRTPHVFSSRTTTGVRAICYGLWHVPVSASMKGGGWMANLSQWRIARRAVDRAIQDGGWCHLRIDLASLATGDAICGMRTIDRLLRHLVQLRSTGHIALETLRDTAARLTPRRSVAAAHSILHAA
ncbi:MAG TPA: hypothetical protein VGJ15_00210 [Pirellulales bacterium]|jgi:hypothetical protein